MSEKFKIPINDLKDKVIIISKGQPTVLDKPLAGYGRNIINWQNGEIVSDEVQYTNKRDKKRDNKG